MIRVAAVGAALALGSATAAAPAMAQPPPIAGQALVRDGDTLVIGAVSIRLLGIDAPESGETCVTRQAEIWPCGRNAGDALAGHIAGRQVVCTPRSRDRYGRTVAVCTAGGEDIAAWAVRNGWARAWPRFSRRYVPDEAAAKRSALGIWF